MIITKAGSDQALFNLDHAARSGKLQTRQPVDTKKINTVQTTKAYSIDTEGLGKLQTAKEALNSLGRDINVADKAMQSIGSQIGQMKDELRTIVKNYPPYPAGSEERVKRMKSYSSLRGLIDQLTYPPESTNAQAILRGSGNRGVIEIKSIDGQTITIKSQPVQTGTNGLNIPTLSETPSNEDIQVAIEQLDQAQETLKGKRSGLEKDVKAIGGNYTEIAKGKTSQEAQYELASKAESLAPSAEAQISALLK
jgi:predicted  nucleic acid-binding Zn-ribbon protein